MIDKDQEVIYIQHPKYRATPDFQSRGEFEIWSSAISPIGYTITDWGYQISDWIYTYN